MSLSPLFRDASAPIERDHATFSNYLSLVTTHIHLDWSVDWAAKLIHGSATLTLQITEEGGVGEAVLDMSYLDIKRVTIDGKEVRNVELGEEVEGMGRTMRLEFPGGKVGKGEKLEVRVEYSTTKECTAIGWLEPNQTKSGKHPYLYSQSQAIHGRSLLPCQDTPAVKSTFSARVRSTLPILMSGIRVSPPSSDPLVLDKEIEYVYDQPVAIPTYLIAIVGGELEYAAFRSEASGRWRTGVWTEPARLPLAKQDYEDDMPWFVETAEKLIAPYRWGVYDCVFLPESFPFGGMENADLTFASPSCVTGDKSNNDVIAHEIAHSWFGNGIGCASWRDFWLNEGWTTYAERLLIRERHGEAARQLSFLLGRKGMMQDIGEMPPRFKRLVPDFHHGEDPDLAFSRVPYDKGSNLLYYLEGLVGGVDVFVPYMKDYIKTFDGYSITTDQWRQHLFHYFETQGGARKDGIMKNLGQVDWDEWFYGTGKDLCVDLKYGDELSKPLSELAARWDAARSSDYSEFSPADVEAFLPVQMYAFLDALEPLPAFPPATIKAIDEKYGGPSGALSKNPNAEIGLRFFTLALKSGPEYKHEAAKWVLDKGRMKFCRAIFRLLSEVDLELARKTFEGNRAFYHPIARRMIAKDLGV